MSSKSRRITRIHRVDTLDDSVPDALFVGNAQQVPWLGSPMLIGVKQRHEPRQELLELGAAISKRSTNAIAVKGEGGKVLDRLCPQVAIDSPVHHAIHGLFLHVFQMFPKAAGLPSVSPGHRRHEAIAIHIVSGQLVCTYGQSWSGLRKLDCERGKVRERRDTHGREEWHA